MATDRFGAFLPGVAPAAKRAMEELRRRIGVNETNIATNTTGLADHLADTVDAHDASAISIVDSAGFFTATTVEGALAELGVWTSYTPDIVATSLSYGTGFTRNGRYMRIGDLVIASFRVTFGTSPSGGSGTWSTTLPVTADTTVAAGFNAMAGTGKLRDASTGTMYDVHFDPAGTVYYDSGPLSNGSHLTIAASDTLMGILTYEAA